MFINQFQLTKLYGFQSKLHFLHLFIGSFLDLDQLLCTLKLLVRYLFFSKQATNSYCPYLTLVVRKCFYTIVGPPGPPLPRPVLPRERGYIDRVVEYLVGDGPSNRYALICRQCQSHNGMALKEEFEYIGKYIYIFLVAYPSPGNFNSCQQIQGVQSLNNHSTVRPKNIDRCIHCHFFIGLVCLL